MSKILVVEDNRLNRVLLEDILAAKGYEVRSAKDGLDSLRKVEEDKPDVILMDVQMPIMDGLESCRRIRSNAETSSIKIIATTASAMKGDEEKIMAAGFDAYVAKPINTRMLLELLESMLRTSN